MTELLNPNLVNSPFQETIKTIKFKTFYHNQTVTFDYDNLFYERRVVVFSLTQFRTICSGRYLQGYIDNYRCLLKKGIDDVYVVDSTDRLIGPYMDKKTNLIKSLPDSDMLFVSALAKHYNYQKTATDLARFWQYIVVVNNGEPEKLWHNPFKEGAKLAALKNQEYRYRKLSADVVLNYLVDNQT